MNSASPKLQDPAKTPEPTMDEILASIRRIITEDQASASPTPRPAPTDERTPRPDTGQPDGVRPEIARRDIAAQERARRDEPFLPEPPRRPVVAQQARPAQRPPAPAAAPVANDAAPAAVDQGGASRAAVERSMAEQVMPSLVASLSAALPPRQPEPASVPREPRDELLSPQAGASVASSFEALTATVGGSQGSRTLEDLVRDMLRPMLKAWLDDNLPALVERLVRQEIERVARGGRR